MKKVLAEVMSVSSSQISLKATTTEKLSFVGREEGVSAYAVALVQKN
jgi:2-C-methyl-D-erythritol 2,4-cyclodiphosphate synthase